MLNATFAFTRVDNTPFGRYCPNTDARNALFEWMGHNGTRSYEFVEDRDDEHELIATLTFDKCDDGAGRDLDQECAKLGLERRLI